MILDSVGDSGPSLPTEYFVRGRGAGGGEKVLWRP